VYTNIHEVRAAEDILTLSRQLKELWLFGQLDTLGDSKAARLEESQIEADAKFVMGKLSVLLAKNVETPDASD